MDFSLDRSIQIEIFVNDTNLKINLRIVHSKICLGFSSTTEYRQADTSPIETLKNKIESQVRIVVDAYCYVHSYGYSVEITDLLCEATDLYYMFGVRGEWNISKTSSISHTEFNKIIFLFSDPQSIKLTHVLADFNRAIKEPDATASYCFRAIEIIRQTWFEDVNDGDKNTRRDNGWKKMNAEFDKVKEDYQELEKFALPNRHGLYPLITYEEREKVMNFTRSIIDSLIKHLLEKNPKFKDVDKV